LLLDAPTGPVHQRVDAGVLALGGASWARLGSDGSWQTPLTQQGVPITPLVPANCGFLADWSQHFKERFAGQPLKSIAMTVESDAEMRRGECIVTKDGLEGGLVYAASARLRQ